MTAHAEGLFVEIDEERLAQMLALVGPASEKRLMRSLIGDLRAARAELLRASARQDRAALREQTHVLASLAGTFGAVGLSAAVQDLDLRSEASGDGLTDGLDASEVVGRTDRLIAELSNRLAAMAG